MDGGELLGIISLPLCGNFRGDTKFVSAIPEQAILQKYLESFAEGREAIEQKRKEKAAKAPSSQPKTTVTAKYIDCDTTDAGVNGHEFSTIHCMPKQERHYRRFLGTKTTTKMTTKTMTKDLRYDI